MITSCAEVISNLIRSQSADNLLTSLSEEAVKESTLVIKSGLAEPRTRSTISLNADKRPSEPARNFSAASRRSLTCSKRLCALANSFFAFSNCESSPGSAAPTLAICVSNNAKSSWYPLSLEFASFSAVVKRVTSAFVASILDFKPLM